MERAAVLIGVSRTGGLAPLQAVASGVEAMAGWAAAQGIAPHRVVRLSDEGGQPVRAAHIKDAVRALCDAGTVDQLVLYFAGHGVNMRYAEYWLLSGAPADTQEAVNVAGSVELARHCGIGHVVIVSDACRTAAGRIDAQNVTGSEVFPNTGAAGAERPVDIFFAATLGHESLEVKDPAESAATYRGVFTESLVSALSGQQPDVIERLDDAALVRPRPLKRFLARDVDRRLRVARVALAVFQEPDARITSDDDAWVSRLALSEIAPSVPTPPPEVGMPGGGGAQAGEGGEVSAHETPVERSRRALRSTLGMGAARVPGSMPGSSGAEDLPAGPAAPEAAEGPAGFVVHGASVVTAESWQCTLHVAGDDRVVVTGFDGSRAADVLLTFDDGSAVVLPALSDRVARLTFGEGELRDVSLSSMASYDDHADHADPRSGEAELRTLRGVLADSSRSGLFRLEGDEADVLARRMQLAGAIDPTLALYAAYAYDDLRRLDHIVQMGAALRADLGVRLFDVALLAGDLDGGTPRADDDVFPSTPMLARGWATLRARGIRLDPAYDGIEAHLLPSLWTLLDPDGAAMARAALDPTRRSRR